MLSIQKTLADFFTVVILANGLDAFAQDAARLVQSGQDEQSRGHYAVASELFATAIKELEKQPVPGLDLAHALSGLADAKWSAQLYESKTELERATDEADELYARSMRIRQQVAGEDSIEFVDSLEERARMRAYLANRLWMHRSLPENAQTPKQAKLLSEAQNYQRRAISILKGLPKKPQISSRLALATLQLAQIYEESHDWSEAASSNAEAIKSWKSSTQDNSQVDKFVARLNNNAVLCFDQFQYDLATTLLEEAIQMNPNYALAYGNRGLLRYRLGDKQGSADDYIKFQQLDEAARSKKQQITPQAPEAPTPQGKIK